MPHKLLLCESVVSISRCGEKVRVLLAVLLGSVLFLVVARVLVSLVSVSLVVIELCV